MKTNINTVDFNAIQKYDGNKLKGIISIGGNHPPKNNIVVNTDNNIIFPYSAKKNKAKVIDEYSTLKPDTNSDSPSVKSKGVLLDSANAETKNNMKAGNSGIINQISF